MTNKDDMVYIKHILDAISRIEEYSLGVKRRISSKSSCSGRCYETA